MCPQSTGVLIEGFHCVSSDHSRDVPFLPAAARRVESLLRQRALHGWPRSNTTFLWEPPEPLSRGGGAVIGCEWLRARTGCVLTYRNQSVHEVCASSSASLLDRGGCGLTRMRGLRGECPVNKSVLWEHGNVHKI